MVFYAQHLPSFIFADSMPVYSLTDLNQHIRETIADSYPDNLWVRAEIVSMNVNGYSGHCYLELTDSKEGASSKIKAMIWKGSLKQIDLKFITETGRNLEAGMMVQVLVKVEFHVQFGLSLIIWDIDPAFTVGDLAVKRAKTINKLKQDGHFDANKTRAFPFPADRIALISSPTAAGYEDFCKHLIENPFGFTYGLTLFPALVQGQEAIVSLQEAFRKVETLKENFDLVILIRGGGSRHDLQIFDEYEVASAVAKCSLPVLTGIGHERDESVCDLVAARNFKTPTATADFLLEQSMNAESAAMELLSGISNRLVWSMKSREQDLDRIISRIGNLTNQRLRNIETNFRDCLNKVVQRCQFTTHAIEKDLIKLESEVAAASPKRILDMGYARILQEGKRKKSKAEISVSSPLKIQMKDGEIKASIQE